MVEKLTEVEVQEALLALNEGLDSEWQIVAGKLFKVFVFKNFIAAFGWMTQAAIWAEKLRHHPEWFNVYNKVEVYLTTHDAAGISELDFKLAGKMERMAAVLRP